MFLCEHALIKCAFLLWILNLFFVCFVVKFGNYILNYQISKNIRKITHIVIRVVAKWDISSDFKVNDSANQVKSLAEFFELVAVPFGNDSKAFNSTYHVFNLHPGARHRPVVPAPLLVAHPRLVLPVAQRELAIRVHFLHSPVPAVRKDKYPGVDARRCLEHGHVMRPPVKELRRKYPFAFPVDDDLCLYRVSFFLPE